MIQHNVIEVAAGETVDVPVYVKIPEGKQAPTNLTFTATSETDPNQTATGVNVLLNDISAAGITALIERLQENGQVECERCPRINNALNSGRSIRTASGWR